MRRSYSEFFELMPNKITDYSDDYCGHCGLTCRYLDAFGRGMKGACNNCTGEIRNSFKGLAALREDLDIQPGERIGVTTSGGKDSIHALSVMTDLLGRDRVVALTHHKNGLTDPVAEKNLRRAVDLLGVELITVEERQMLERFRRNLALLIKNPDPAIVRVVLCAGCRYGITKQLYAAGVNHGIRKYVSAASYLELAPFKEELLALYGNGDVDTGFYNLMARYREYDFGDNLYYIERDNGLKYKSNRADDKGGLKDREKEFKLFDLDNYVKNDPEKIEHIVRSRLGWQRSKSGRSWHFDCVIEEVKDMFYYGMLGFTETDFKLAGMVRYGLLTVDEARKQLAVVRQRMEHSYPELEQFFIRYGLSGSLQDLWRFYRDSRYLCTPEKTAVHRTLLTDGCRIA